MSERGPISCRCMSYVLGLPSGVASLYAHVQDDGSTSRVMSREEMDPSAGCPTWTAYDLYRHNWRTSPIDEKKTHCRNFISSNGSNTVCLDCRCLDNEMLTGSYWSQRYRVVRWQEWWSILLMTEEIPAPYTSRWQEDGSAQTILKYICWLID